MTYWRKCVFQWMDGHFTEEGVYVTFNRDLSKPSGWSPPRKIPVAEDKLAWYPQVLGVDKSRHETDKLAGRVARFFIRGQSRWEILFLSRASRSNSGQSGIDGS